MQTNFYSKFGHIHSSVHTNANLLASTYKFSTITSSTVLVGSSPDDKIFSDHIMSIVCKTTTVTIHSYSKTPVTVIYMYVSTHIYRHTYRTYTYIHTHTDTRTHTYEIRTYIHTKNYANKLGSS